jgi:hypothetical protein
MTPEELARKLKRTWNKVRAKNGPIRVEPPARSEADLIAVWNGLKDGETMLVTPAELEILSQQAMEPPAKAQADSPPA